MNLLKALVVALVLWMPSASFADAAMSHTQVDEAASSERFADGEAEEVLQPQPLALPSGPVAHTIDAEDASFSGKHRDEPLLPPPNSSSLR